MRTFAFCRAALALLIVASPQVRAQARDLSWPEITVTAQLDADGRLHVRERQVMRFTGDWNGGERTFASRFGQQFIFESLERVDSVSGSAHPLVGGDLSGVDEYDWVNGTTLRWRSRLPSDPPFDGTELTYVLAFTYDDILQPRGDDAYLLDHNFAFTDRQGEISRFAVTLTIDSAWGVPADFTGRYATAGLPPGEGFVVTVPLTRVAASVPAGVHFGVAPGTRYALLGALVLGMVTLFAWLLVRESRLGRFARLTPENEITPEWLTEHVFAHLPEVVGSEWDNETSAPEVAATLARLVQERKLSSTVKTKKGLFGATHVLHLRLEVPRNRLQHHERALVDALFASGEETTDTDRVRERYKKTGFDPAGVLRPRLTQLADGMTRAKGETPSRVPTLVLMATAIALLALGIRARPADLPIAIMVVAASLVVYVVAVIVAHTWQRRVTGLRAGTLGFLLPLAALVIAFARFVIIEDRFRTGAFVLAGLAVWMFALANSVFNIARSRESVGRIARRQRLAAAREYFRAELAKAAPALRDEWFPYVLAFGLGRHIDRWFKSFGGESRAATTATAGYSSGMHGSTSGGGWTGFGGGGGFGGAGGGASFGAAIGGMAASVPSPSSSSGGGGGGGGGGSSGGGGGGGW